jgi:peptide/nickel transport system substrate-binding protein
MKHWIVGVAMAAGLGIGLAGMPASANDVPKRGGILRYMIPADGPPSLDGHRETTFATMHAVAPFYSVLIRVNPDNPASTTDFVCDLCTEMPKPTDNGLKYTFKIRDGVKFHDGSPLTARDVAASWSRIISPPDGVLSARRGFFGMIDKVAATDDKTFVVTLKYVSGAFMPALADPFAYIYKKELLDKDQHWYEKNVMGSGPFKFKEYQVGSQISGERNPDYYHKGKPYLDGFEAIFADKQSVRMQAIRGDRAATEFRGVPPASRDELVKELGKDITIQESDWNCVLMFTPNIRKKPFDDVRVRKALTLAVDRWKGAPALSKIATVRTVGGIVFPGSPLAATKQELESMAGYWPDIEKSRAEAKRLLKEAGAEGLEFELNNRNVDQPYKFVGTWLIDEWSKVGLKARQRVQPTGPFFDTLTSKRDFDVTVEFNCQANVNPISDTSKYVSASMSDQNYGGYEDATLNDLYTKLSRSPDPAEQRTLMRQYEKRLLDEQAYVSMTPWWSRIIAHRSYMKGWKINPSHYLNLDLSGVWIDKQG